MGVGRPRLPDGQAKDTNIIARVEKSLADEADELAARMDVSRSWVLRRALIEYLERELGD
jgi:predicted transcriptional regulator